MTFTRKVEIVILLAYVLLAYIDMVYHFCRNKDDYWNWNTTTAYDTWNYKWAGDMDKGKKRIAFSHAVKDWSTVERYKPVRQNDNSRTGTPEWTNWQYYNVSDTERKNRKYSELDSNLTEAITN